MGKKEIGIGIIGLGNVGTGTLEILTKNKDFIEGEISPNRIKIIGLADLDASRKPKTDNKYWFTHDAGDIIKNSDLDILVEAIGGEYPAYNFIKQALEMGKHVVTPNKEVVAKHGYELLEIAQQNKVQFLFETSVGSAIPILGVITNILTSCPLDEISGILNGTTNYILDLMAEQNMAQEDALKKAQQMGYAEADPSKDVNGLDALFKIFILATLGFRGRLDLNKINFKGISGVTLDDTNLAKLFNYRIKLIATARRIINKLEIGLGPVLIEEGHLLSHISGADNGIFLSGQGYGNLFLSGPGAGGIAAASMMVSDIVRIIRQPGCFDYDFLTNKREELEIGLPGETKSPYFLRIKLEDDSERNINNIKKIIAEKGFLTDRTAVFKDKNNSLSMGFITSSGRESEMIEIIQELKKLDYVANPAYLKVYEHLFLISEKR